MQLCSQCVCQTALVWSKRKILWLDRWYFTDTCAFNPTTGSTPRPTSTKETQGQGLGRDVGWMQRYGGRPFFSLSHYSRLDGAWP
jgi:hypothetical protein